MASTYLKTGPRQCVQMFLTCAVLCAGVALAGCAGVSAPGGGGARDGGMTNDNGPPDDRLDDLAADSEVAREIEEADIVKIQDGFFYLANRFRGFRIIDARTIERPVMMGGVDVGGRAVELIVRGERAYLITSNDFFPCAGEPLGFDDTRLAESLLAPAFPFSRFTAIDISDKGAPAIVQSFDFEGFATATRRIGDVIYVAGNFFGAVSMVEDQPGGDGATGDAGTDSGETPGGDTGGDANTSGVVDAGTSGVGDGISTNGPPGDGPAGGATTNGAGDVVDSGDIAPVVPHVFVVSIDIADPAQVTQRDEVQVSGRATDIHVTADAMFVFGEDPDTFDTTLITFVDISDPAGTIAVRDAFRVPGTVLNRFFMDAYQDVLRVVTEELAFVGDFLSRRVVALYNYDLSDPDNVTRLARLTIKVDESLRSVRFDGPRGYAVTFRRIDPFFILDLSDPVDPQVLGELEVSGFSTHLVPLGDRVVTVGFDGPSVSTPSVSLFDVSDPTQPLRLSRILIGEANDFSVFSEATFDEKALTVLENEELILMPFAFFDDAEGRFVDALQLIDLQPLRLRERGQIEHRGLLRRSGVIDTRLWTLSDESFQVGDIDDRDEPLALAKVNIITDQELLDAGLRACVDTALVRGTPFGAPEFLVGDAMVFDEIGPCGTMAVVPLFAAMVLATASLVRTRARRTRSRPRPSRKTPGAHRSTTP